MSSRPRGYVLLALLVMLSLLAAGTLLHALTASGSGSERRERRTTLRALQDARLALIAYGLVEDNTPGSLPCPASGLDGHGGLGCTGNGGVALGRLPWYLLGMMARFDGTGECLWYGLGKVYANQGNVSQRGPANALNPGRAGGLSLLTDGAARPMVAVLLAPGRALAGQRRHGGDTPCADGATAAFLESGNADGDAGFLSQAATAHFNDQLAGVARARLMRPLLRRVLLALGEAPLRAEIARRLGLAPTAGDLAQLRLLDAHGFDALLHPDAPLTVAGACPYRAELARHPVAWLCFNDWYRHIVPLRTGGAWTLNLALATSDPGTYRCRLGLADGRVACGTETLQ